MKRRSVLLRWGCVLLVPLLGITALSEWRLVPLLTEIGIHRSQSFYEQTVCGIVADVMEEIGISGEDLVAIRTTADGHPTAMTADTATLNRLQAELNNRLSAELRELDSISFSVPMGTVFGGAFWAHCGPPLNFRLTANEIIAVRLTEEIRPTGINQTCYSLSVTVEQNMLLLYAGRTRMLTMNSTVLVAQTVLLGQVPDTFATWEN